MVPELGSPRPWQPLGLLALIDTAFLQSCCSASAARAGLSARLITPPRWAQLRRRRCWPRRHLLTRTG